MGRPKKEKQNKRSPRGIAFNDAEFQDFKNTATSLKLSIPDLIVKAVDEFKKLKLS